MTKKIDPSRPYSSLSDLMPLAEPLGPRFVSQGHVIVNQRNTKNRDPVVIKDVLQLIEIKETTETDVKSSTAYHIYVISYLNKAGEIKNFKFDYNAYTREEIQLFYELTTNYLERMKKLELFTEFSKVNPVASVEDLWIKVEETYKLLQTKDILGF